MELLHSLDTLHGDEQHRASKPSPYTPLKLRSIPSATEHTRSPHYAYTPPPTSSHGAAQTGAPAASQVSLAMTTTTTTTSEHPPFSFSSHLSHASLSPHPSPPTSAARRLQSRIRVLPCARLPLPRYIIMLSRQQYAGHDCLTSPCAESLLRRRSREGACHAAVPAFPTPRQRSYRSKRPTRRMERVESTRIADESLAGRVPRCAQPMKRRLVKDLGPGALRKRGSEAADGWVGLSPSLPAHGRPYPRSLDGHHCSV